MNLLIANNTDDNLDIDLIKERAEKTIACVLDLEKITKEVEVSLSIVGEDEIHKLNKSYRDVDRPTDVLSFPMDESFPMGDSEVLILGDIVICLDIAKNQAKDFGHSLEREMMYLICHSCLHLLGYDHIDSDDKRQMREKEKQVMKRLKVFK